MHTACIKKFFGTTTLPVLDYTTEQLDQLALQIIHIALHIRVVPPLFSPFVECPLSDTRY